MSVQKNADSVASGRNTPDGKPACVQICHNAATTATVGNPAAHAMMTPSAEMPWCWRRVLGASIDWGKSGDGIMQISVRWMATLIGHQSRSGFSRSRSEWARSAAISRPRNASRRSVQRSRFGSHAALAASARCERKRTQRAFSPPAAPAPRPVGAARPGRAAVQAAPNAQGPVLHGYSTNPGGYRAGVEYPTRREPQGIRRGHVLSANALRACTGRACSAKRNKRSQKGKRRKEQIPRSGIAAKTGNARLSADSRDCGATAPVLPRPIPAG